MDASTALVVTFFDQARSISLGEPIYAAIPKQVLIKIVDNPSMAAEFKRQLKALNDQELREYIIQNVLDQADSEDRDARLADRRVELVDRAGLGPAAGVTATGIGFAIAAAAKGAATGSLLGPIGTLGGGLVGLVATAFGRHVLKTRADDRKSLATRLRRLVGSN